MADDASIKVSKTTRDRLARLAAERGTTLKGIVEELAEATPIPVTPAESPAEREAHARAVLAEHFGVIVGEAEMEAGRRLLEYIANRRDVA